MPYLRACPVTASNPAFPVCKLPAERPIYTNENCHSCERVLWNMEVLRKEEEHRQLHKRQECHCEVIFDAEERERRVRPRGKGKGKGKEQARFENEGLSGGEGVAGVAGVPDVVGVASVADKASGVKTKGTGTGTRSDMVEAGPSYTHQDWAPDAQMAAYQYVGYHNGGNFSGPGLAQQEHNGLPIEVNNQMALAHRPGYPAGGGVGRMDLEPGRQLGWIWAGLYASSLFEFPSCADEFGEELIACGQRVVLLSAGLQTLSFCTPVL